MKMPRLVADVVGDAMKQMRPAQEPFVDQYRQAWTMKYFFHLEDGACIRDPTGEEFPDDAAALLEAAKVAHELSKARVHANEWRVVVKDATGRRVGSVPLVPPAGHDQGVPVPPTSIH